MCRQYRSVRQAATASWRENYLCPGPQALICGKLGEQRWVLAAVSRST